MVRQNFITVALTLALVNQCAWATEQDTERQHRQAMALARTGQHDRALTMLQALKTSVPGRYSIQRDFILVASWKGDCQRVIDSYLALQQKYQHYTRVVVPASTCLREQNRVRSAIAILEAALARNKGNHEIEKELEMARTELSAQTVTTEYELETNNSDAGNREWRGQAMAWTEVGDHLFGRARFTTIRAADPQFATGDLNRVGVGLDYSAGKLNIDGELSSDISRAGESGISTTVKFTPADTWNLSIAHHTFSEAVPLRAKALFIASDQRHFAANYHSSDYVWEWLAAVDWMDFSDSNRRREWFSELGYGIDLNARREKRLMFEISQATNTLPGTVYYNPLSAQTVSTGYKFTRVLKSNYKRKSDEYYVWLGDYQQQNYGSNLIYGLRYRQDYQMDKMRLFSWRAGVASKAYDGNREGELEVALRYVKELQ